MKQLIRFTLLAIFTVNVSAQMPMVSKVELQPFASATQRLLNTLKFNGAPLPDPVVRELRSAMRNTDQQAGAKAIETILDRHCLAGVHINAESRVKVSEGPVKKELMEHGWRIFLVKVVNEAGVTAALNATSPNALPQFRRSRNTANPKKVITPADVVQRFLDITVLRSKPSKPRLSGLELEYRVLLLGCRDTGKREATIAFDVGQGTQDLGFRNEVAILFDCVPAVKVRVGVKDFDGKPTSAAFVIKDHRGRVYPNPTRRLAPDFFFHDQVYRADGEHVLLPPGQYNFTVSRGPEYHPVQMDVTVPEGLAEFEMNVQLKRWTHPARLGWYSGDHHIHAAGCSHYDNPTEGVSPADMMRHVLGEDLNVACVLTWGPCWYSQKGFFEGKTSALSRPNYLLRYDVEVSGFPSSHAGHLCLLRLSEDDYPGTTKIEEWPSWTLPVLKWGKEQGGVVGYSHSGWGIGLPDYGAKGERMKDMPYGRRTQSQKGRAADKLPDYAMPPFDGIGANEYIVTVAHDVCDFISAVDTPSIWELNIWYHTLNCGFRTRISGETDFPCIYGDKVGLGRIYVKLDKDEELNFDNWVKGLKNGRSYCGDGMSHLIDFKVNQVALGEPGSDGHISQLNLAKPGQVQVTVDASALLQQKPNAETKRIRGLRLDQKPYWHIERSRIGGSRTVPVELIVNGHVVARRMIHADGSVQQLSFEVDLKHSSWIALRILPSAHTNPIFVEVGSKAIRASRRSAEWCIKAVDTCWKSKEGRIREDERQAAKQAYEQAKTVYRKILAESVVD